MKDLQKVINQNKGGYRIVKTYTATEIKGEHELALIALRNAMFRYGLRITELEPHTVCNQVDIRRAYDFTFQLNDVLYDEHYVLKFFVVYTHGKSGMLSVWAHVCLPRWKYNAVK